MTERRVQKWSVITKRVSTVTFPGDKAETLNQLKQAQKDKKHWYRTLVFVSAVPVLCLFALCLVKVIESGVLYGQAKHAAEDTENCLQVEELVQLLQQEAQRAAAFVFVGRRLEYNEYQRVVDGAIEEIDFSRLKHDDDGAIVKAQFESALHQHRHQVLAQELTAQESTLPYFRFGRRLMRAAESSIHLPQKGQLWKKTAAAVYTVRASSTLAEHFGFLHQLFGTCENPKQQLRVMSVVEGEALVSLNLALDFHPPLAQTYQKRFEDTHFKTDLDAAARLIVTNAYRPHCLRAKNLTIPYQTCTGYLGYRERLLVLRDMSEEVLTSLVHDLEEVAFYARNTMLIYIIVCLIVAAICGAVVMATGHMLYYLIDYLTVLVRRLMHTDYSLEVNTKRMEKLLCSLLPRPVALSMVAGVPVPPKSFSCATICYVDLHRFLHTETELGPQGTGVLLTNVTSIVEAVADKHNVIKMEFALTDTFLITSGIPEASENHPEQMADFALDLMEAIKDVSVNGKHIEMKIGIHSGPVAAAVIGHHPPRYSIFGEAVKIAEHMCHSCPVGKIQLSESGRDQLRIASATHNMKEGTEVEVKRVGQIKTYFLEQGRAAPTLQQDSPRIQKSSL